MNKAATLLRTSKRVFRAEHVTMAHGGGGSAMRDLIDDVFISVFQPDSLEDQARLTEDALSEPGAKLAFTTDGFVVDPVEFPGGDIGKLAICGTVNDLAVGGARPLWLSVGFIIEEGTEVALLRRIVATMKSMADEIGVKIVTGDTKVVERGSADKVFITTSGIGVIPPHRNLSANSVQPGDAVIVNGYLGDHGAAIMAARGDLALVTTVESDCQSLSALMETIVDTVPTTRCARDATRGGAASVLNEIAEDSGTHIVIDETKFPIRKEVKGICEILGLDPLYLANEGTLVVFVPGPEAQKAIEAMQSLPAGRESKIIGHVKSGTPGRVEMTTVFGGARIVDMLVGDQLPRIC